MFATALGMGLSGSCAIAATAQPSHADVANPADLAASAQLLAVKGKFIDAIRDAEHAVALAPRKADYRSQLGQLYFASGRFVSAETAFGDALSLDPSLARPAVSRALAQLVLGRGDAALLSLAQARGKAPDADVGLALALAGQRSDALALLEGAVRAGRADARTRQNLALVYAFEGRWNDAAAIAAHDVPADRLADRLRHWALIVQRGPRAADQVLALLGATIAADPGQPAALALAPASPAVQVAEAAPVAALQPSVEPAPLASQKMPAIAVVQAVAASSPRQSVHIVPARSVARPTLLMKTATMKIAPTGRFVVQLGAYRSAGRVETAWRKLAASAAYLAPYGPAQSEIRLQVGRVSLYRLALSGFETRADAARICSRIRARGGKCFVRAAAGDHPMTWALKADRSPNRV